MYTTCNIFASPQAQSKFRSYLKDGLAKFYGKQIQSTIVYIELRKVTRMIKWVLNDFSRLAHCIELKIQTNFVIKGKSEI